MATFKWSVFCLFSIIHIRTGTTQAPYQEASANPTKTSPSAVRRHHHFRMDPSPPTGSNNVGPMELSILRLLIRKYAKESKLSKDATKKLQKIFEGNPPKIGSENEDRSEWSDRQWKQDELEARLRRKRVKDLAHETINEHKELNTFFRKMETHEENIKREVDCQVREDLRRIARRNHLEESEFDKFMDSREANKPVVHWRLNMHPNEVKKADATIKESWGRTKHETLNHLSHERKPFMKSFLEDVEETSARRLNRQRQNDRAKQFLGDLFHRRQHMRSTLIADSLLAPRI